MILDRVTEYAQSVVDGDVIAGRLHRLACERHLNDLEKSKVSGYMFYWDVEAADTILNFAEMLTIAEGSEPQQVELKGFQVFKLGSLFGWKNHRGFRRFRRSYISMARQNGKTFLNGIVGPYIAAFGGYNHGKLFTVATKKRQAKLAWNEMAKFIEIDDDLLELFKVTEWNSTIHCHETNSTIEALSKEAGLDDGFRSVYTSIDEIHQHRDGSIYQAISNGTRNLDETLISMITTRGKNLNSFAKEMDEYAINILEGRLEVDTFFADIHCIDEGDDYFDMSVVEKANPFLMSKESGLDEIQDAANEAQNMGGESYADYLVKVLNIWIENSDDAYIDTTKWKESATDLTLNDYRGRDAYVGLDLSSGGDLTTLTLEFEDIQDGGESEFFIHSHSFMPRGRIEEHKQSDLVPYDLWEQQGLITVTGGPQTFRNDYNFIINYLQELIDEYDINIQGIAIDPHNADGIMGDLEDFGAPVLVVNQSARFMNDATVDFRLLVKSGLIKYNRNQALLTWSMTNAKITLDSFGNIKVDKKSHRFQRIDPVDSVLDSHTMLIKSRPTETFNADSELEAYLKSMGWS